MVGDAKDRGITFRAKIDLVESMGSELYAYFELDSDRMDSDQLQELAQDSGAGDVPGGDSGQIVARLDAASQVKRGEEAELWVDTSKLHLFDPQSGDSLTSRQPSSAGT